MSERKTTPTDVSPGMICALAYSAVLGVDGIEKTYMSLRNTMMDKVLRAAVSNGVRAELVDNSYHIDIYLITQKGVNIPKVCRNAQIRVKNSVEIMSGYPVADVNIHVVGSGLY